MAAADVSPRRTDRPPSAWRLRGDVLLGRVLLVVAGTATDGDVHPDVYLYLADRYRRLADHHFRRGRRVRADRLAAAATRYGALGGWDPPPGAALAMPLPRCPSFTAAVAGRRGSGRDDAA
jgi:hypothetical protein